MTSRTLSLDQISIAAPCSASWEGMSGDDRQRHCDSQGARCSGTVQSMLFVTYSRFPSHVMTSCSIRIDVFVRMHSSAFRLR